jgi:hypothetical protein
MSLVCVLSQKQRVCECLFVCLYKVGEILRGESQHKRIASNLRDGAYFYEDVSIFRVHCSTCVLIARMKVVRCYCSC